jgi:leucyl/phenylalanyl-tRNA--protein transferase
MTADTSFAAVIEACAEPRQYTDETWITPQMRDAYITMHGLGWAHSFEAWDEDELIGGLYGLAIGNVFFGESMFSRRTDASKVAFVNSVAYLRDRGFELIDCQVWSHHLKTLGARTMPREEFLALLNALCSADREPGSWSAEYEHYLRPTA